jgi:plastocyanin
MRFKLSAALVVLVLIVGACAASNLAAESAGTNPQATTPQATTPSATQPVQSASATTGPSIGTAEITIGTDTDAALTFEPANVRVPAGSTIEVTFENRASVPHNLTFEAPISVATSMTVAPGATETIEFAAPDAGDYGFVCTLHPGMGGTLTVEAR